MDGSLHKALMNRCRHAPCCRCRPPGGAEVPRPLHLPAADRDDGRLRSTDSLPTLFVGALQVLPNRDARRLHLRRVRGYLSEGYVVTYPKGTWLHIRRVRGYISKGYVVTYPKGTWLHIRRVRGYISEGYVVTYPKGTWLHIRRVRLLLARPPQFINLNYNGRLPISCTSIRISVDNIY